MKKLSGQPDVDLYNLASVLAKKGEKRKSIKICEELVRDGYAPAHFLLGNIYEFGGDQIKIDISRAISHYRKAAYSIKSSITFIYLARVLMKQGGESHELAFKWLQEASAMRDTPELALAYAKYYENASTPNYEVACKYYIKAALFGRFQGFFGYAAILRKLGKPIRALGVDCLRILSIPLLLLLCGRRASDS